MQDVRTEVFVDQRGVGTGGQARTLDHRQRFKIDPDGLQCRLSALGGHGRDRCYSIACVAHLPAAMGEDGLIGRHQAVRPRPGDIVATNGCHDTGQGARRGQVDRRHAGMGLRAAQDAAKEHLLDGQIIRVAGGARHLTRRIQARDGHR